MADWATELSTRLYALAPVWAQNLLITAFGLRLQRLRYGGVHDRMLEELVRSQWQSTAELEALQLASLNQVLAHARQTVPFYREAPWATASLDDPAVLGSLPVLTKEEVQRAGRAMVSDLYAGRKLIGIHTGGTTGRPLTVHCDPPTLQRNYAFFSRLRGVAGIPVGGRVATFAGRVLVPPGAGAPFWRRNRAGNAMLFSSYHLAPDTVGCYADGLAAWAPDVIDTYPSSIEPIARHLLATGDRRIRPRAVITSSESLLPEVRGLIEEAFGCRVFDYYGSAEMVAFISQCEHGSYHVNPEFGVVELLRDGQPAGPGETGEIVATSLINPVMPLIRYAMGDWASWDDRPCRCGRHQRRIREIGGRIDDVIVTPEGRLVGRLDPVFKAVNSLFEARIIQDAADHLRVEIVAAAALPDAEREALLQALRDRVGTTMRIDLVMVDRLERTGRGKHRMVVNEWRRRTAAGDAPGRR